MPTDNQYAVPADFEALMDKDVRREIIANPRKHAEETGMDVEGKEVVVATCSKDVLYIPVEPPSENTKLSDTDLDKVSAAGIGQTLGTAGTAASLCCFCTTASSASTAGTAG